MPLFEEAILELPKKVKDEDDGQERLALGPVCVIAKKPQSAAISAVLDNHDIKVDRTRMGDIDFTDRYHALGIPYPNPETMCKGQCEGTGWVPVFSQIDYVDGLTYMDQDDDPRLITLWREAHDKAHTLKARIKSAIKCGSIRILFEECDGWHFVKCPDCDGTGKRKEDSDEKED